MGYTAGRKGTKKEKEKETVVSRRKILKGRGIRAKKGSGKKDRARLNKTVGQWEESKVVEKNCALGKFWGEAKNAKREHSGRRGAFVNKRQDE